MAAEMAAIPLRKRDADTAVVTGNFNRTKRGEGKSTPPQSHHGKDKRGEENDH